VSGLHVARPPSSPDWPGSSPCVNFRPNISQRGVLKDRTGWRNDYLAYLPVFLRGTVVRCQHWPFRVVRWGGGVERIPRSCAAQLCNSPRTYNSQLRKIQGNCGVSVMPVFLQSLYRALAFWRQKSGLEVSLEKDPSEGKSREGKHGCILIFTAG
jgi:hypothetical protein